MSRQNLKLAASDNFRPYELLRAATRNTTLTTAERIVLVALILRCHSDGAGSGVCWPGLGLISADTGLSKSSVIRTLTRLSEDAGPLRLKIIKKSNRGGNEYTVSFYPTRLVSP